MPPELSIRDITKAMMNAPELNPPRGPRLAFYTTPENMNRVGYEQTQNDTLMNYVGKTDGNTYAWISDDGIKPTGNKTPKTIGDMMEHPWLFKAYPGLKNKPIGTGKFEETVGDAFGSQDESGMYVSDPTNVGTLMHETQHWIQDEEGWFGTNTMRNLERKYDAMLNADRGDKGSAVGDRSTYLNRGDEIQARAVNRTLVDGIPAGGIESNMERELIHGSHNPYEIRDPRFKDTVMQLGRIPLGDYANGTNFKYDKVPGTGGLVAPDFDPAAEDGGMLDDAEFDKRLGVYREMIDNASWRYNDGPQLVNPYRKVVNLLGGS